ncbi:MAG: hypothetical protein ACYDC2_12415, partial [Solirubrobacteraceae bacterium]
MLRFEAAVAAATICLLSGLSVAQATQSHSASFRRCAAAHKASYKGSRCPKRPGSSHRRRSHSHALFFKAVGGHCRDANLTPTAANLAEVRAATLCLVNRERAGHREQPLHWNDKQGRPVA